MAERTDTDSGTDLETALEADRKHVASWRSTPAGEADYQDTVERMKKVAEQLRAKS